MGNPPGQSFCDCGLADTRLAHQQGVVLAPPTEDLNHPLDFRFAPDQRVNPAFFGLKIQVGGVLIEGARLLWRLGIRFGLRRLLATRRLFGLRSLRDAMTDEIDDIKAGNPLLVQVVNRMRVLLTKNCHQHIRPGDFFFAVGRALDVHDRALDHSLKPERGLRVDLLGPWDNGGIFPNELGQILAKVVQIGRAGPQNLGRGRVIK